MSNKVVDQLVDKTVKDQNQNNILIENPCKCIAADV